MRTSLKKLRGFALHRRNDSKDRRDPQPSCQLDELAQASQDMHDMTDCYNSLLAAAAATANSAYEFSESLREMGACLLEKTALSNDEESGKVLLMLGKVQFELQKLIDSYRSHIVQTITIPSESLLNELRTVEEMKEHCDDKRDAYECMITKQREKGRSRSGKGDGISAEQLQAAHDEYDEEATLFVFRLKSLKQGQSRSLLTQAARHHASQLCFFRKALKSLEAIEPHVKVVTEQQHIDYHFTGLEEDDGEDGDDDDGEGNDDDGYDTSDAGELSFDYGQNSQGFIPTSGNLMELDQGDLTFPPVAAVEAVKENLEKRQGDSFVFGKEGRLGSQSAPLFAEKKLDPDESMGQMQPSPRRKFRACALPTPAITKAKASAPIVSTPRTSTLNLWHSSPLEAKKLDKVLKDNKMSRNSISSPASMFEKSNNNIASRQLPPPLVDGFSLPQPNPSHSTYSKKIKRQAFSGPLARPTNFGLSGSSSPIGSRGQPKLFSGPLLQNPTSQPSSSPKVSSISSPSFVSSPKISELHELPRPPANSANSAKPLGSLGHSAPLLSSGNFLSAANRSTVSNAASRLPAPPQALPRSFSIPSSSERMVTSHVSQPPGSPQNLEKVEYFASPPLTPISLPIQLASTASVAGICEVRGAN